MTGLVSGMKLSTSVSPGSVCVATGAFEKTGHFPVELFFPCASVPMYYSAHDRRTAGVAHLTAQFRRQTAGVCDWALNDQDLFGDGDQSDYVSVKPGDPGKAVTDVWAEGGDFSPFDPDLVRILPNFHVDCFFGRAAAVYAAIAAAAAPDAPIPAGSRSALQALLELRASVLRVPPITCCIAGARVKDKERHKFPDADHLAVAKALIDAGCRVDAKDIAGCTPLHHCVSSQASRTSLAIVKLLGDAGANPELRCRAGWLPLAQPTMSRMLEAVTALLDIGANPVHPDRDGFTALQLAQHWPAGLAVLRKSKPSKAATAAAAKKKESTSAAPPTAAAPAAAVAVDVCAKCGMSDDLARVENSDARGLQRCVGCNSVAYCSDKCQRTHAKVHQPLCAAAAARALEHARRIAEDVE